MGQLLKTFTFERVIFRDNALESAETIKGYLERVRARKDVSVVPEEGGWNKNQSNILGAYVSSLGLMNKVGHEYKPTQLADVFEGLYTRNPIDAWQWLITRALWRFVVPNGTNSSATKAARELNVSFAFFRLILGILIRLDAESGNERYLYYDELCRILDDDNNWGQSSFELYRDIMRHRNAPGATYGTGDFLGDLEAQYGIPRDNFNGLFRKTFAQTGLFDFKKNTRGSPIGVALSETLDTVKRRRVRFILDNPVTWNSTLSWQSFLEWQGRLDLPPDVSLQPVYDEPQPVLPITLFFPDAHVTTEGLIDQFFADTQAAGLIYDKELITRFVASCQAKPFIILSGLAGSGKTKLAQAFARWLTVSNTQYEVVAVGADWTSKDFILGYPNALFPDTYMKTDALDLVLHADHHRDEPHFLILDEMNLSHVERYFADILSALESNERISLHSGGDSTWSDVPSSIPALPSNLFIIGTVNVDETTYQFSPKVLDRANVLEFRINSGDMQRFLNGVASVDLTKLQSYGVAYASAFVRDARNAATPLEDSDNQRIHAELTLFFNVMAQAGVEFGYRTASEIIRFVRFHKDLSGSTWRLQQAMDAQIVQKLLPKMSGSRRKLERPLWALANLCYYQHVLDGSGELVTVDNVRLQDQADKAFALDPSVDPLRLMDPKQSPPSQALPYYPISFAKIVRMLQSLEQGFTSFAEA